MDRKVVPTVIIILIIFFILVQTGVVIWAITSEGLGLFWNLLVMAIPLGIIIALIAVYIERMKEIDEEDKDDLSKY